MMQMFKYVMPLICSHESGRLEDQKKLQYYDQLQRKGMNAAESLGVWSHTQVQENTVLGTAAEGGKVRNLFTEEEGHHKRLSCPISLAFPCLL